MVGYIVAISLILLWLLFNIFLPIAQIIVENRIRKQSIETIITIKSKFTLSVRQINAILTAHGEPRIIAD